MSLRFLSYLDRIIGVKCPNVSSALDDGGKFGALYLGASSSLSRFNANKSYVSSCGEENLCNLISI